LTKPTADGKPVEVLLYGEGGPSDPKRLTDSRGGDWKFIIIESRDMRYLVLGPISSFKYHAFLVTRFCEQHGLRCHTVKKPDLVEILDNAVVVRGGGRVRFDEGMKSLVFFDSSRAYGSFSGGDLRKILSESILLKGVSVTVAAP
jgi:hypothetical protein